MHRALAPFVALAILASFGCYSTGGGDRDSGSGARGSGGSAGTSGGSASGGSSRGGTSSGGTSSGGSSSGGESSAGTSSGGSTSTLTCERLGGQCNCVGACPEGYVSNDQGSCGEPIPNSGACSLGCCIPDTSGGGSGGTSSATLILQCHPDTAIETCPETPPVTGTPCGDANLCCNYSDGQGCVCTGSSYVCESSACTCSG